MSGGEDSGAEAPRPSWSEVWNRRYSASDLVWGEGPNQFLAAELEDTEPRGRVLDLACGEGRNAIWLAARGWQVTAVDFSDVAIERGRRLAGQKGVELELICDDVTSYRPSPGAFALVVVLYMQIPPPERRQALSRAYEALEAGGQLWMVGHARSNVTEGVGGPQDPEVLWEPSELAAELGELGFEVSRSELLRRHVEDKGDAIDALIEAQAIGK
jgi:SAM-dependent methyltransferase